LRGQSRERASRSGRSCCDSDRQIDQLSSRFGFRDIRNFRVEHRRRLSRHTDTFHLSGDDQLSVDSNRLAREQLNVRILGNLKPRHLEFHFVDPGLEIRRCIRSRLIGNSRAFDGSADILNRHDTAGNERGGLIANRSQNCSERGLPERSADQTVVDEENR
jgi:hypothetical protein